MSNNNEDPIVGGIILTLVFSIVSIAALSISIPTLNEHSNYTETTCNVTAVEIEQGSGLFGKSKVFVRVTFEASEGEPREERIAVGCGRTVGCVEVSERYPIGSELTCYWYPDLLRVDQELVETSGIITVIVTAGFVLLFGTCVGCCTGFMYRQDKKRKLENP